MTSAASEVQNSMNAVTRQSDKAIEYKFRPEPYVLVPFEIGCHVFRAIPRHEIANIVLAARIPPGKRGIVNNLSAIHVLMPGRDNATAAKFKH